MRLQEKVIVVTGSTTGIGKQIARRCVAEGARVLVHGLEDDDGLRLVAELGPAAVWRRDDLVDPEAPSRIVAAAFEAFGRLDALVNNAALVVRSELATTDAALFDRVMAINVRAPLLLIQQALPHLTAAGGCVLNIGSLNYFCGERNLLAYSLSKGALTTLSRNLGDTLQRDHGVRVNHLNIGWTLTENEYRYKLADGLPADWPETLPRETTPTGRLMTPDTIASAAVYWLSDESRPLSGTVVDMEQYPLIGHIRPVVLRSPPPG